MAIKEGLTVLINYIRFNYIGLPRSGKTCCMRRITGDMENIVEAMKKGEGEQPSTGLAEDGGQVVIRKARSEMAAVTASSWSKLEDLETEANVIIQWIHQLAHNTDNPVIASGTTSTQAGHSQMVADTGSSGKDDSSTASASPLPPNQPSPPLSPKQSREINVHGAKILSIFKKAMESEDWDKVKHNLEKSILINNMDAGGHMELLDMHAALVHGPSLNLLFRRLVDDLDKEFKIYFTEKDGKRSEEEDSTVTVEAVLFQALAGIAGFCSSFSESQGAPSGISDSRVASAVQSKALFVGTFRDQVSEQEVKAKDQLLRQKIENTDFYERDIVEFASEEQLMLVVDNMNGGQEEIDEIRSTLENVMERCFERIKIPASWLALGLYIRSVKSRTISLQECEAWAGEVGIDPGELQHVLWFLHHRVGVLLYFPEVDALKTTVIRDMQVVFDSATNLTKKTFTFKRVGRRVCNQFKETGRFSQADVRRAALRHTDELIPLEKLVELLQHLNILTLIPPSQEASATAEPTYFMPCVLKSARAKHLNAPVSTQQDPAPLMIRYNCGYTPLGLFPAMIVCLVSQPPKGWEIVWKGLCKNRVQFRVGLEEDCDTLTLLLHPQFIEIALSRDHESKFVVPTEVVCADLRSKIKATLKTVTSRMNSTFTMGYRFGFECPKHPGRRHLCTLPSEAACKMECLENLKCKQPVQMESHHKIWFSPVSRKFSIIVL